MLRNSICCQAWLSTFLSFILRGQPRLKAFMFQSPLFAYIGLSLMLACVLQVDRLIPKHYLPPIIRLCGKLEMLDRLLPKLKATDHRV
jgi:hypothetical protein